MSELKPGVETSEWTVTKWIMFSAGLLGLVTGALTAALPASGAVEPDSIAVVVLGTVTTVAMAIGGGVANQYVKGRAQIKAGGNG